MHSALSTCPYTWGLETQILKVSCLLNFPSAPPQPSSNSPALKAAWAEQGRAGPPRIPVVSGSLKPFNQEFWRQRTSQ